MTQRSLDNEEEGAASAGGAPSVQRARPGVIARLASARLTLWLLAILAAAMALATLIPQNAADEAYLKAFGTLFGPLVIRTILRNIYGSWLFIGAFALLAVNLLACSLQRAGQLLGEAGRAPEQVALADVLSRAERARWRLPQGVDEAAAAMTGLLSRHGYGVLSVPGAEEGQRGLVGRRGRWTPWVPVVVHLGMVVILIGAAWGRLPGHAYQAVAPIATGETFPVTVGEDSFGLRLADAGMKHDAKGAPTDFWAKVEVLEEGKAVRSETVRPNHPLRYHSVTMSLQSVMPIGYAVEVTKGESQGYVPVVFAEQGVVDMMSTVRRLDDPPWVVFIHAFRDTDEQGKADPAAQVFVDQSGELSHSWKPLGWVGAGGSDYAGVHFRLVRAGSGAQLSLDRDVGIPIVFLGFIVIALGSVLVLGGRPSSVVALVSAKGRGSQVVVGASQQGGRRDSQRLLAKLASGLGAVQEAGSAGKREETP